MSRLKPSEWSKVEQTSTSSTLARHGLPVRRSKSVVIGTFNIRDLGSSESRTGSKRKGRTPGAWKLLARVCSRFDLLAVQEVLDDLSGLRRLQKDIKDAHNRSLKLVVSDIAGHRPGGAGETERLAFLYNPSRIEHTELAAEVTSDRATVAETLYERRTDYAAAFKAHKKALDAWEIESAQRRAAGKRKKTKPWFAFPTFLTFIRPPHVASFRIKARGNAKPIDLLAVNAHLLYGKNDDERLWEFLELV
ncbi:MAG: hypothetical protein AAFX05_14260, partial [Planctomycetota bacterium]